MKNYKSIRREDENTFSFQYEGTDNELWIDVFFTVKPELNRWDQASNKVADVTHIEIETAVLSAEYYEADVRFDKSYEDFFIQPIVEMIEYDIKEKKQS